MRRWSNCWIKCYLAGKRFPGCEIVFIPTRRKYKFPIKFRHCFLRLTNGYEIEYVPIKGSLGDYPPPLFKGKWRIRRRPDDHETQKALHEAENAVKHLDRIIAIIKKAF